MRKKRQMIARINSKYNDFYLRVCLVRLVGVIGNDFKGCVSSENKLSEAMKAKYGWGNKTTRKRLEQLQALDIITMNRVGSNKWTKEYRFREA